MTNIGASFARRRNNDFLAPAARWPLAVIDGREQNPSTQQRNPPRFPPFEISGILFLRHADLLAVHDHGVAFDLDVALKQPLRRIIL